MTQTSLKSESKRAIAQQDIKEKLIIGTLEALEQSGVQGVKARDVAKYAGCAVGTIYNLVGDLDDLILLASARTLEEFRIFAISAYEEARKGGANDRDLLIALAGAYIDYSAAHPRRWQANFELTFDAESDYYRTYVSGQKDLIIIIVSVLMRVADHKSEKELASIARALWASVHGISMLAMSNPSNVLPRDKVLEQCVRIIDPVILSLRNESREQAA